MTRESRARSILKAITWRLIATLTTFTIAYLIFSSDAKCDDALTKSTYVAGIELFLKLAIYYFHERLWQMVPEGAVRNIFKSKKS